MIIGKIGEKCSNSVYKDMEIRMRFHPNYAFSNYLINTKKRNHDEAVGEKMQRLSEKEMDFVLAGVLRNVMDESPEYFAPFEEETEKNEAALNIASKIRNKSEN